MGLGSWKVDVQIGQMPQKVATAMAGLKDTLVGAEYTDIAYLGSQEVNGINHAVLAEQEVLTGHDYKNIVVLIFNEKPGDDKATLVSIDRVVEGGNALGGMQIDVKTDIPEEALDAFKNSMMGWVGAKVTPFALVATKMTKGLNYIFVATFDGLTPNSELEVALVMVNEMTKKIAFADLLSNKMEDALGYAFSW